MSRSLEDVLDEFRQPLQTEDELAENHDRLIRALEFATAPGNLTKEEMKLAVRILEGGRA